MYYILCDRRWTFGLTLPEAFHLFKAWRVSVPKHWHGFCVEIYRDGADKPLCRWLQE